MDDLLDVQLVYVNSMTDTEGRSYSKDLQKYFLGLVVYTRLIDEKFEVEVIAPNFLFLYLESLGYSFVNGLWYNRENNRRVE